MAKHSDLRQLVETFVSDLEAFAARKAHNALAGRLDALRSTLLTLGTTAPRTRTARRLGRRGPRPGYVVQPKPCPVCGKPSKARRYSYLCDDHRTPETIAKFQGRALAKAKTGRKRA